MDVISGSYENKNLDISAPPDNPVIFSGVIHDNVASEYVALLVGLVQYTGGKPSDSAATVTNTGLIQDRFNKALEVVSDNGLPGSYITNELGGQLTGTYGIVLEASSGRVVNAGAVTATAYGAIAAEANNIVINEATGKIVSQGLGDGVSTYGTTDSIINSGMIAASNTAGGSGITLGGGTAHNLSGGTITSAAYHAVAASGFASLTNAGLLAAGGTHSTVGFSAGGQITNTAGGTITGQAGSAIYVDGTSSSGLVVNQQYGNISTTGTNSAVVLVGAAASVVNAGLISTMNSNGIRLDTGGAVQNLATGTITSTVDRAVYSIGGLATLKNAGLLTAGGTHSTVVFDAGGTIINQTDATISSQAGNAVYLDGTIGTTGTLLNAGTIATTGTLKDGLDLLTAGYVSNAVNGLITGTAYGLHLQGLQGSVVNAGVVNAGTRVTLANLSSSSQAVGVGFGFATPQASLTNASTGSISGGTGVAFAGNGGTLLNAGTITGRGVGDAVVSLAGGGVVSNQLGADIAGSYIFKSYGVAVTGSAGTVTNNGMIFSRTKGVYLGAGGMVLNSGSIGVFPGTTGGYAAVEVAGNAPATVINAGIIGAAGSTTGAYGIVATNGLYLTNRFQGTIAGSGGVSVKQGSATVTNAGTIQGNGTNGATIVANGTYGMGAFTVTTLGSVGIYTGGGLNLANTLAGTISGGNGVFIHGSGFVTNAGLITGQDYSGAISVFGTQNSSFYLNNTATGTITNNNGDAAIKTVYASSTVVNSGIIGNSQFRGGVTFTNNAGGSAGQIASVGGTQVATVVNGGTLQGVSAGYLGYAALVDNAAEGIITGFGVNIGDGTVINAGTMTVTSNVRSEGRAAAIYVGHIQSRATSVYIDNFSTGIITATGSGVSYGIVVTAANTASATITNLGTIVAPTAISGSGRVYVQNSAGGLISGAISPSAGSLTLVNAGMITADGTSGGVHASSVINQAGGQILVPVDSVTVVNAGIIGSAAVPGVAVTATDLVVQPGARFHGSITGSAPSGNTAISTIELAAGSGRLAGFGSQITNFNSVVFDAGAAWTIEGSGAALGLPVISGLAPSDMIDIDGFVAQNSSFLNGYLSLTSASNGHVSLDLAGSFTTASFIISGDGAGGTDVSLACFRTGTRIATPTGERVVEDLAIGDPVLTASGQVRPIKWIGKRGYMPRFVAGNSQTQPILFRAGSLAEGIPHRDLFVSSQHAMFLDGILVPAGSLMNGSSIVRATSPGAILYLHIELDSHDVILAEGAPAETFVDDDSRGIFHNASEFAELYPDAPPPAGFCAPRIEDGYQLAAIRTRLAARARYLLEAAAA